jgi:tetrahydromethanopterin S-methyltransferase subunit A
MFLCERLLRPGSHAHWTELVYLLLMFGCHAVERKIKSNNEVEVAMKQKSESRLHVTGRALKSIWAKFNEAKWVVGAEVAAS